jgi:hypothetical protein
MSLATTVQNWTPRQRGTREVCDFLDTSSENSVSTYNQPYLESTQNQPSFFCLKFWALGARQRIEKIQFRSKLLLKVQLRADRVNCSIFHLFAILCEIFQVEDASMSANDGKTFLPRKKRLHAFRHLPTARKEAAQISISCQAPLHSWMHMTAVGSCTCHNSLFPLLEKHIRLSVIV